jgi:NADPH-dependent glutamate synthase beta subunit-like oxidoreductase
VTVFEAREGPGGMVAWAIPAFRLTEEDIRADLDRIANLGVEIRYGQRVGRDVDFSSLRGEGYGAVVVAVGAQAGQRMGIEGEDCEGVTDGLTFLQAVRRGEAPPLGEHTVIIGGGNAAMDAARTAWRLSGEGRVSILYRRTRREMPADPEEVAAVEAEGVAVEELVMPVRVNRAGGRISGLTCVRMALTDRDASGRPRPVPVEGSEFELPCSTMLMCVSQRAVLDFAEGAGLALTRWDTIKADPQTRETSAPGVFAAGGGRRAARGRHDSAPRRAMDPRRGPERRGGGERP